MVLNPTINLQNNGCGTISKCSGCMFKLICDKSPYCSVKNSNDTTYSNFQEQLNNLMSSLSTINNNIMTVSANNQQLSAVVESLQSAVNAISENVDKLLSSSNSQSGVVNQGMMNISNGVNENVSDGSDVVPYTPENQDATVLVEKKNIFGKSKWVEKKI